MHRPTGPFLALISLLVLLTPLAGSAYPNLNPTDMLFHVPKSDVVARAADSPQASLQWEFDHDGITGDEALMFIPGAGYLLRAPQRLMLVAEDSLQPVWEKEFDVVLDTVEVTTRYQTDDPQVLLAHSGFNVSAIDLVTGEVMWTYEKPTGGMSMMVHGDTIVRRHYHMSGGSVFVVDRQSGEDRWSAYGSSQTADYVAIGDSSIAVIENDLLTMYDLGSGDVLWSESYPIIYGMDFVDRKFLVLDSAGLTAVDGESGSILWNTPLVGAQRHIGDDNGFIIVETAREALGIETDSGEILWSTGLGQSQGYPEVNVQYRGMGKIRLSDSTYVVYSRITGELLFHIDGYPGDIFGPNHTLYQEESRLVIVDDINATVAYEIPLPADVQGLQGEFTDKWLVYIINGEVRSLDLESGEDRAIKSTSDNLGWSTLTHRNVVMIMDTAGVEIYSLESGQLLTTLQLTGFVRLFEQEGGMFLDDGDTVVGFDLDSLEVMFQKDAIGIHAGGLSDGTSLWADSNDDGDVVQLQAWDASGEVNWTYSPDQPQSFIDVYLDGDDEEVWLSDDDYIYVLNDSGEPEWQIPIPEGVHYTSTVFMTHGVMFFDGDTTSMYGQP